jgi:hypothetical protein
LDASTGRVSYDGWNARQYLSDYYSSVDAENDALLRWFAEFYAHRGATGRLLEFGCGPTIYQLISAAASVSRITLAEYDASNRQEIEAWLAQDPAAWDWRPFVRSALIHEGLESGEAALTDRERRLRLCIESVSLCDAFSDPMVTGGPFSVVSSNFVLESLTTDIDAWRALVRKLIHLVEPGGYLLMSSVEGSSWVTNGQVLPTCGVTQATIRDELISNGMTILSQQRVPSSRPDSATTDFDYSAIILSAAHRPDGAADVGPAVAQRQPGR